MARRRLALGCVLVLGLPALALTLHAGQFSPQPHAEPFGAAAGKAEFVQFEPPGQVQLAAGKPAQVELRFHIRDGLHINSHKPLGKDFIRTELVVAEPPGIDVAAVTFPEGSIYASAAFPGEKLSVYTGELALHMHLSASKPGEQQLAGALHYQACDAEHCFPPKTAPVELDLMVR